MYESSWTRNRGILNWCTWLSSLSAFPPEKENRSGVYIPQGLPNGEALSLVLSSPLPHQCHRCWRPRNQGTCAASVQKLYSKFITVRSVFVSTGNFPHLHTRVHGAFNFCLTVRQLPHIVAMENGIVLQDNVPLSLPHVGRMPKSSLLVLHSGNWSLVPYVTVLAAKAMKSLWL